MANTNQNPIIDTQRLKERNTNIPLKKVIKPQGKKQKEEQERRTTKTIRNKY